MGTTTVQLPGWLTSQLNEVFWLGLLGIWGKGREGRGMRCLWWLEKHAGDPQWSLGVISVSAKRTPVALGKIPELHYVSVFISSQWSGFLPGKLVVRKQMLWGHLFRNWSSVWHGQQKRASNQERDLDHSLSSSAGKAGDRASRRGMKETAAKPFFPEDCIAETAGEGPS